MSKEYFKSGVPRVLVVENDLRWREDHQTNLNRWMYDPFLAEGQGSMLQKDAIQKASKYRCHVALVDMRLLNHHDESDNSGLLLVPNLKPTRSIIITGYSSDHLTPSVLKAQEIDAVMNKRKGGKLLKEVLDVSLEKICAAKKGIKVIWQDSLSAEVIISSLLAKELSREVPADEVDDLLGLLFPSANVLTIQKPTDLAAAELAEVIDVDDQHVVMLDVYVDESSQPMRVQISQVSDLQDEIPMGNRVKLWDLAAQLCS